jgi:uncharacterized protein (DUF2062 family)
MKRVNERTKGLLIAMSGLFAAGLAASLTPWHGLIKACLAAGVAMAVSTTLWVALPKRLNH